MSDFDDSDFSIPENNSFEVPEDLVLSDDKKFAIDKNTEENKNLSLNEIFMENNNSKNENDTSPSHEEDKNHNEAENSKIPFSSATEKKKKKGAAKLNRQLILIITVIAFLITILTIFLQPAKKKTNKEKDVGSGPNAYVPDFEAMANNSLDKAIKEDTAPVITNEEFGMTDDQLIAKAEARYEKEYGEAPTMQPQANNRGNGGYTKPDTRNNYVQKQIQGIKGLTPTGRQNTNMYQSTSTQTSASANPYENLLQNMPSKEEFAKKMLGMQGLQGSFLGTQNDPNNTAGKENFYSQNIGNISDGRFLDGLTLWQGTVIPAVLITGINTDLPGNIIARVTKNIYSSLDGRFLLIPQGTLLFASYNSSISYAQNRVQVAWTQMIRPDGLFVDLGNMTGVDNEGYSGYKGYVDNHPWAFIKGLLLVSAISLLDTDIKQTGKALASNPYVKNASNPYVENFTNKTQGAYQKITDKIIDRALDIQPTIKIKAGITINILTNSNLTLPPVEIPEVTQKYIRYK